MLSKWATGVKPTLSYNFVGATSLDTSITFTRASSGTYFDSAGLLQTASTNVARFDYNPTTLAARGLLREVSRTNLPFRSQEFDVVASGWGLSATSVSANATTAPDGNVTADKIQEDTSTANHYITNSTSAVTSGTTYTASAFLKAAERGFAFIVLGAVGGFPVTGISINLTTGAVSTATGTPLNAFTQTLPNGWFRVGFSLAANATGSATFDIRTSSDGVWANRSYTGTAGSGIYGWGAQLEAGTFPTSYIATTTAAVTRATDVATVNTLTPWYNITEGTLFVECQVAGYSSSTNPNLARFENSANSNYRMGCFIAGASPNYRTDITDGGVNQLLQNVVSAGNLYDINKWALAYKLNDSNSYGRTSNTTDTSCTIPSGINRLQITADVDMVSYLRSIRYYPTRLPNSTLQAITA